MIKFRFLLPAFGLFFIGISSSSFAEGPKLWIANDGGLSRDYLTNGKQKVKQGFFGSFELRDLVKDNASALALTEKQSQFNTYAHISYWVGVIPSAAVFGYGLGSQNLAMSLISCATLLGTSLLTGHFVSESRHYMYAAMNTYNGVKQNETLSSTSGLNNWVPLASNTHSFQLSFAF